MRFLAELLVDVAALGGAASFVYGVHLVYPPAAFIVGGLVVSSLAIFVARARVARAAK